MTAQPLFEFDTSALQRAVSAQVREGWYRQSGVTVATAAKQGAKVIHKQVRAEAAPHRRSGRMRGRIRTRFTGRSWTFTAKVSTAAPANLIVGGTRPHEIVKADGVMPMWAGRGAWKRGTGSGIVGFRSEVMHPGTAPDPFVDRGIATAQPELQVIFDQTAKKMCDDLARRMEKG